MQSILSFHIWRNLKSKTKCPRNSILNIYVMLLSRIADKLLFKSDDPLCLMKPFSYLDSTPITFLFITVAREKVDKNYQDFVNNIAVKSRRKNVQQRLIKCFWGFDIFIDCHIDLQLIRMIDTKHFLLSFFVSKFCIVTRIIWNWIR